MLKEKIKSISHPELVSGSKDHGFRIKSGMTGSEESGRSMVEMLGVLAVVGVITVAGMAGFNTAMNKHRANELMNEASKCAVMVSTQAMSGQNLNIDDFPKWTATKDGLAANRFQLQTKGTVTKEICQQLVGMLGTNSATRYIYSGNTDVTENASGCKDAALKLIFNDDLSSTQIASDFTAKGQKACTDANHKWCSWGGCADNCAEGAPACSDIWESRDSETGDCAYDPNKVDLSILPEDGSASCSYYLTYPNSDSNGTNCADTYNIEDRIDTCFNLHDNSNLQHLLCNRNSGDISSSHSGCNTSCSAYPFGTTEWNNCYLPCVDNVGGCQANLSFSCEKDEDGVTCTLTGDTCWS